MLLVERRNIKLTRNYKEYNYSRLIIKEIWNSTIESSISYRKLNPIEFGKRNWKKQENSKIRSKSKKK